MIPPYEQCRKLPAHLGYERTSSGEHIVVAKDMSFDGFSYAGWCKFCGAAVFADSDEDYWHPYQFFIIEEDPI